MPGSVPPICEGCEEAAVQVKVTVTDLDGTVLDTVERCRDCVRGSLSDVGLEIGDAP